jgi:hypothetical protein
MVGSPFQFAQHGPAGAWFSEHLPNTAEVAGELCLIESVFTESINHGPGVTFIQTGSQIPGRPSMGAWLSYGLGSENSDLPGFVVLITKDKGGQPLGAHLWGSGFLPAEYQGLQFRPSKDPVLYLNNPQGVSADSRRMMLQKLEALHQHQLEVQGVEPGIQARIANYEMAFRMQTSIPEVTDLSNETESTFELYGPGCENPWIICSQLPSSAETCRKGRAVHSTLPPGLGPSRRTAWQHCKALPGNGSRMRRTDSRSQTTWHA